MQTRDDPREAEIETKTWDIKRAMSALGARLEAGDEVTPLHWVIPDRLACAHRPLRYHPLWGGTGNNLVPAATSLVIEWSELIKDAGIRGIISLMHDRDIQCYLALNLGASDLLEFYRLKGFQVSHIPWEDPHHKKTSADEKRTMLLKVRSEALAAYDEIKKPVLVQCSAGIDRSSPVAAFIQVKRRNAGRRFD